MMNFYDFMHYLARIGIADVLLPFVLVFAIVWAVLSKMKIFGTDEKPAENVNKTIALVMGLSVVIPHVLNWYPPGSDVVVIINSALPNISAVMVAAVMVLILIGIFGFKLKTDSGTWMTSLIPWLSIAIVAYIFSASAGWIYLPNWLNFLKDPDTQALVVMLLVFGVVVWFVTKPEKTADADKFSTKFKKDTIGSFEKK